MTGPQHAPNAAWSFLIFTCAVGSVGGTIACLETVAGHTPSAAARHERDVPMQSLQMLVNDGVYAIQRVQSSTPRNPFFGALQARETTTTARLVARVRDVRFDRAGRMAVLYVASPALGGAEEPERVLPASAVMWDDSRRQWVVTEPNLQFTELEVAGEGESVLQPSVLASQLLEAEVAPPEAPAEEARAAIVPAAARATIWIAPGAQRLAVAVIPFVLKVGERDDATTTRYVPVPWSCVRATPRDDVAMLELGAKADAIAAAPTCLDAQECPLAALRERSYEHFAVAAPAWDDPLGTAVAVASRR